MDEHSQPYNRQFRPADTLEESSGIAGNRSTYAVTAAIALLILTLTLIFYSFNLGSQLSQQERELERLEQRSETHRKLLALLESESLVYVPLRGLETNPDGYGRVFWDPGQHELALQVSNLPPLPDKSQNYVLWLVRNNEFFSIGVIGSGHGSGPEYFYFDDVEVSGRAPGDTFLVTLESDAHSDRPNGARHLIGK